MMMQEREESLVDSIVQSIGNIFRRSSPVRRYRSPSPVMIQRQRSPIVFQGLQSPIQALREQSPIRVQRQQSPIRVQRQQSPIRVQRQLSPIRVQRQQSPVRIMLEQVVQVNYQNTFSISMIVNKCWITFVWILVRVSRSLNFTFSVLHYYNNTLHYIYKQ